MSRPPAPGPGAAPDTAVIEVVATGGPDVLRPARRPRPVPGPTEVLVRVHAAGVNPVDWKTRRGDGVAGVLGPLPWVLGWDVSGVVEELGAGVTRFAVGDRVLGMPRFPAQAGGYAEWVTAPSRQLARVPDGLDHVHAAALPLAGLTAWQALVETADVRPGQRVLVHAAGGGVGHLAVQLARRRGARVIATASAAKHPRLRELGAHDLVDRTAVAFERVVAPVDVVLDLVGGDYAHRSLEVLRPGGVLLEIPSGADLPAPDVLAARGVRALSPLVEPDAGGLEHLVALVDRGDLVVDVARTAPLSAVADLHRLGERGRTAGKLVAVVVDGNGAQSSSAGVALRT